MPTAMSTLAKHKNMYKPAEACTPENLERKKGKKRKKTRMMNKKAKKSTKGKAIIGTRQK